MITRIVRMSFRQEAVGDFLDIFREAHPQIKAREGCREVRLMRDHEQANVLYTISLWEADANLQAYRNSDLFDRTWKATKALFNDKPRAWSLEQAEF